MAESPMLPATGICSGCGHKRFLDLDGMVQYHDWPRITRRICAGAKQPPADDPAVQAWVESVEQIIDPNPQPTSGNDI